MTFLVPEKFGPREIWALRTLVPSWNCHIMIFMWGPNFLGSKFSGDQISQGPKKWRAQMRSGTISVTASLETLPAVSPAAFSQKIDAHTFWHQRPRQLLLVLWWKTWHWISKVLFWERRNDEVPRLGGVKGAIKESTPALLLASILKIWCVNW